MKFLLFLWCLTLSAVSFAQNTLHPALAAYISNNPQQEFVSIRIDFHDYFDARSFHLKAKEENVRLNERVPLLIQSLQQRANENQALVSHFLSTHAPAVSYWKGYWIADVLFARVKPALLSELLTLPGNFTVHLEDNRFLLHDPLVESKAPQTKAIEGVEPGVLACNVRPLWDLGYTGRGRKVFIYDTGVWPDHPAFADRFLGHHTDMHAAWYGYYSPDPTGVRNNHGTHVLGTAAGLSPIQNDTIGVAFGAYWIANDLIGHSTTVLPGLEDMMACFEWALNPDGNPFTLDDMPDVINNSWRWHDGADMEQCEGPVVQLMNAVEAAGIANVFSGGNFGPNNSTVSAPQRINTSEVNTFSVGSVNGNMNFPHPISTFSSIGPKQCPGEGSLSIHPEIVAPGQNIRSAWKVNEYNTISGTSMASPHVSGVILLLKEAFPGVTGEEILWALYLTAIDLGEPGEDNVYGMGMIDAFAAYQYLANIYTPVSPSGYLYDLAIEQISLPFSDNITCESSFLPQVVVKNKGTQTISSFSLVYQLDGQTAGNQVYTSEVEPGASVVVQLDQVTSTTAGNVSFKVSLNYQEELMDSDPINNTRYARFNIRPHVALPFTDSFEQGFSDGLWAVKNPDKLLSWDTTSTVQANFGKYAARLACFDYSPNLGQKDELITPFFSLNDTESATLRFDVAYLRRLNSQTIQDSLRILIKKSCLTEVEATLDELFGTTLASSDDLFWNFAPNSPDDWTTRYYDLTPFQGQTIAISFQSVSKSGNNIFLDNVKIFQGETEPLHAVINEKSLPKLYPNPNNGEFILETPAELTVKMITLYDLSGSVLYTHDNVDNYLKINLDFLPKGLYFVEVKTDGETFHLRTIKQ